MRVRPLLPALPVVVGAVGYRCALVGVLSRGGGFEAVCLRLVLRWLEWLEWCALAGDVLARAPTICFIPFQFLVPLHNSGFLVFCQWFSERGSVSRAKTGVRCGTMDGLEVIR